MSSPPHPSVLPCDHCGYDLTGIAPDDAASPQMRKCPECGNRADIRKALPPPKTWWRFPLAVLAGAGTIAAVFFAIAVPLGVSENTWGWILGLPLPTSGAVSMAIVWQDRLANLRWAEQHRGAPRRHRWSLLFDFVAFCILNSLVFAGATIIAILVLR